MTVAVLALVAFAAAPNRVFGWFTASNTATADDPMVQPPVAGVATSVPSVAAEQRGVGPDTPTRKNPFAGSPAINYADNEAGLSMPEAKAVPGYSVAEVAEALDLTRRLLIAGNLDRDVLAGARPAGVLALLDPSDELVARIENSVTATRWDADGDNPKAWMTRFDPTDVEPVGSVVKVNGITSYDTDREGMLTVHTDYSFVYPVAKTGSGAGASVTRSVVRRVVDTKVYRGPRYRSTARGRIAMARFDYEISNSSCTRMDGFVRPQFPADRISTGPPTTGAPTAPATVDPYNRSRPIDEGAAPGTCPVVSRI
ncbi:hypothetical protein ACFZBU_29115 [Embleya sp. NPDC008237]|uniref:hypothetical protein n=1 Tax=Embleya sp. NPDC008237 TaxID=3363978 RepID=UPI0036E0CC2D